jgi:hypothetical protein
VAAVPGPAHACSCLAPDPGRQLPQADGAFNGTFLDRDEPTPGPDGALSSGDAVEFRFRVDEVFKGEFGPQVGVLSANSSASCGLAAKPGDQIGLIVAQRDGRWHGSLCSTYDANALRAEAGPGRRPSAPTTTGQDSGSPAGLVVLGAAVVLVAVALGVGLAVRRRRAG